MSNKKGLTTFNRIEYVFIFGSLVILTIIETERVLMYHCVFVFETVKWGVRPNVLSCFTSLHCCN